MESTETQKATLFDRLGGLSGITAIVDDAVDLHTKNPAVSARFLPYLEQPERLAVIKQHSVEFFAAGSGGPVEYTGKDMPDAHTGMNISREEYTHVMDDIMVVLGKHGIDEDTQKDVLAILWSLRDTIISK